MLTFHSNRLRALRVRSENCCPASELDLLDWIAAGMEFGRRLKAENPAVVEKIVEEARGKRLENTKRIIPSCGGVSSARNS
jgi:hypothetical protein